MQPRTVHGSWAECKDRVACVFLCCVLQDQHSADQVNYWLRHVTCVAERIPHMPRMNQARLPVLLFESCAQQFIVSGLLRPSQEALLWELDCWLQALQALSPDIPQSYWHGLVATYVNPSEGTARPVFADLHGEPR